jgi:dUTP pyrophosphatase
MCKCKNNLNVQIKKLHDEAIIPEYKTSGAAAVDLHANLKMDGFEYVCINPGERILVKTGIAIDLPENYEAQIRPRSGLALNYGISLVNAPGTIDSDYFGDVGVIVINHGQFPFVINHGNRIAQMVIAPVTQVNFLEVDKFETITERGEKGFGSSGM